MRPRCNSSHTNTVQLSILGYKSENKRVEVAENNEAKPKKTQPKEKKKVETKAVEPVQAKEQGQKPIPSSAITTPKPIASSEVTNAKSENKGTKGRPPKQNVVEFTKETPVTAPKQEPQQESHVANAPKPIATPQKENREEAVAATP